MTDTPRLTKHRVVMILPEQSFEEVRKFTNLTEEEMLLGGIPEAHYITKENWIDMGSPEVITVTVEAGDLLNTEGEPSDG